MWSLQKQTRGFTDYVWGWLNCIRAMFSVLFFFNILGEGGEEEEEKEEGQSQGRRVPWIRRKAPKSRGHDAGNECSELRYTMLPRGTCLSFE